MVVKYLVIVLLLGVIGVTSSKVLRQDFLHIFGVHGKSGFEEYNTTINSKMIRVYAPTIDYAMIKGIGWRLSFQWKPATSEPPPPPDMQDITISRNNQEFTKVFAYKDLQQTVPLIIIDTTFPTDSVVCECYLYNDTTYHGRYRRPEDTKGWGLCRLNTKFLSEAPQPQDTYSIRIAYDAPGLTMTTKNTLLERDYQPKITQKWINRTQEFTCTTQGIPAPTLVWSTDWRATGNVFKAYFNSSTWNVNTKTYQATSVFRTNLTDFELYCTAQQWQGNYVETGVSSSVYVARRRRRRSGADSLLDKKSFLTFLISLFFLLSL